MRKFIPVEESFARWRKDPEYVAAYDALEDEFALIGALIGARAKAGMTQGLESGRMPSTRTLQRFAEATGTTLRISFEPIKTAAGKASARKEAPARPRNGRRRAARKAA
jgi:hypothetical protein